MKRRKHWADFPGSQSVLVHVSRFASVADMVDEPDMAVPLGECVLVKFDSGLLAWQFIDEVEPIGPVARDLLRLAGGR
jgi:hypothetical protein